MRPISQCRSISQPNNAAANLYNIKLALEASLFMLLRRARSQLPVNTYVHRTRGRRQKLEAVMNYQKHTVKETKVKLQAN